MAKKICLVTWHTSLNYGTCIQAYALAECIRKQGCDVFIPSNFRYYYGILHPIDTLYNILVKMRKKWFLKSKKAILPEEYYKIRLRKNENFAKANSGVISFQSRQDYKSLLYSTDIFMAGSDQIWNPYFVTPTMLLCFAPKRKKIVSYASSIGVKALPRQYVGLYNKYLLRFDAIGVREETAKKELCRITGNNQITVVLDPSFLLTRDDWEKIASRPEQISEDEEFVFCYFIGNQTEWISDIIELSEREHIRVVYIPGENMKNTLNEFDGIFSAGVEEFIWCLLKAKYVITDSFHATALSINFNTKFMSYKRFLNSDGKSQNSRIYDLLITFKLEKRLKESEKILEFENCDFTESNKLLCVQREKSLSFLKKEIGLV